jgi:hypothetical protein
MSLTITGPSAAVIPAPPVQSVTVALTQVSVNINPPHELDIIYVLSPSGLQKTCTASLSSTTLTALEKLVSNAIETNEGWAQNSSTVTGS